jgi:opacity protein-like surface antigen
MHRRFFTIASVAAVFLAAGAAASELDADLDSGYLAGVAAEHFAAPFEAADDADADGAFSVLTRLDLQPLRARLGGDQGYTGTTGEDGPSARMLQLYYDVGTTNAWRPYVGAGVGFASGRPDELTCMTLCSSLDDADRTIGYQFMAGVTYAPKKDITFFAEHRLSGTARGSLIDTDGARSDFEGMRDRAFGGGVRIGF